MEYNLDNSCLEDSLVLAADPAVTEEASTAATPEDASDRPRAGGALPALVQVGGGRGLPESPAAFEPSGFATKAVMKGCNYGEGYFFL